MARKKTEKKDGNKILSTDAALKQAVSLALKGEIPDDMDEIKRQLVSLGAKTDYCNGIALAMVLKALSGDKTAIGWVSDICKTENEVSKDNTVIIISGDDDLAD